MDVSLDHESTARKAQRELEVDKGKRARQALAGGRDLRNIVEQGAKWLEAVSLAAGSGHGGLARRLREMATATATAEKHTDKYSCSKTEGHSVRVFW
jgi:hypothetical protein